MHEPLQRSIWIFLLPQPFRNTLSGINTMLNLCLHHHTTKQKRKRTRTNSQMLELGDLKDLVHTGFGSSGGSTVG